MLKIPVIKFAQNEERKALAAAFSKRKYMKAASITITINSRNIICHIVVEAIISRKIFLAISVSTAKYLFKVA